MIATRLLRSTRCDAAASVEATRMVNEKIVALVEAHTAAGIALVSGKSPEAAVAEFVKPYVKRVRANHRRLHRRVGRAA